MQVTVVGTGYVGLVSGVCLAEIGNNVTCVDIDPAKIDSLNNGQIPIYEPGLQEMMTQNKNGGRLNFCLGLKNAPLWQLNNSEEQIIIIAVGTPPGIDGGADLRFLNSAVNEVINLVKENKNCGPITLVIKSTVPVGTNIGFKNQIHKNNLQKRIYLASNPEFLREGRAIEDFMRPDRIIVGAWEDQAFLQLKTLYRHFIRNGHDYLEMDPHSSEMTKYAANIMLATRISLMNEIAQLCSKLGADVNNVRLGIGKDKRIGMQYLYPGVGFGGSCFPKDVLAFSRMADENEWPTEIIDAVWRVNKKQKVVLANKIINYFDGDLEGKTICIWGLAFKPKTDDIREAPALTIINRLLQKGAKIKAYDPEAVENVKKFFGQGYDIEYCENAFDAAENCDAIALVTEWAEFRNIDLVKIKSLLKQPVLFDGRNQYENKTMENLGYEYYSIGRPNVNGIKKLKSVS